MAEFREMRRLKQKLSEEECIKLLITGRRGVLAVSGEDDYPYALPINFLYDEGNRKIYFHGAKAGHKIDALRRNNKVSFCVYDEGEYVEGDWAPYVKSVIIFGRIRLIEDPGETVERVRELGLKYYPAPEAVEEEILKSAERVQMLELSIDHMSGKRVHEK